MIKVLFVCLGNICRSPMAEAVFRDKVNKANMQSRVTVSSAATSGWEVGSSPHRGTKQILDQHHITYEGIKASQITAQDFTNYDFIIGMDQSNVRELTRIAPKGIEKKIYLFLSMIDGFETKEVPDPYYTGNFEQTYTLVDQGTKAWLDYFKNK